MESPPSTLVKNNLGRLAIDDYIEWYIDSGDNEDIPSDSSEAEDDSDDSESFSSTSNESEMQSRDDNLEHQLVPPFMSELFTLRRNWQNELWSPIPFLLICSGSNILEEWERTSKYSGTIAAHSCCRGYVQVFMI